jgi:hypothetical protein
MRGSLQDAKTGWSGLFGLSGGFGSSGLVGWSGSTK